MIMIVTWRTFPIATNCSFKVLIPDDFMDLLISDLDDLIRPDEVRHFYWPI